MQCVRSFFTSDTESCLRVELHNTLSSFQDRQLTESPVVRGRLAALAAVPKLENAVEDDDGGSHLVYGLAVLKLAATDWPSTNLTLLSTEQRAW